MCSSAVTTFKTHQESCIAERESRQMATSSLGGMLWQGTAADLFAHPTYCYIEFAEQTAAVDI